MNQTELKEREKFVLNLLYTNSTRQAAKKLKVSHHTINSYKSKFERLELWNELEKSN